MIGDSYEILFQIKTQGQAALEQVEANLRSVDAAGKSASASVDGIGGGASKSAGAVSSLSASLRALLAAIEQNTASSRALTSSLDSVKVSSSGAASGVDGVARAARGLVPEATAATGALRTLDGALNIRSAGRFLTDVLGLGGALRVAFPIFAAISFVEVIDQMIDKVGQLRAKWDPFLRAQADSLEIIKQTAAEFERLTTESARLRLDKFERQNGRPAAQREEARGLEHEANSEYGGTVSALQETIAAQKSIINTPRETHQESAGKGGLRTITVGPSDREIAAAKEKLVGLNAELDLVRKRQEVDLAQAADLRARADKTDNDKRVEDAKKATAEIASAEKEASSILREAQTYELSGLAKIIVKRQELLEIYGKSKKAIDDINAAMNLEQGRELGRIQTENRDALGRYLSGDGVSTTSKADTEAFQKQLKESISAGEKDTKELEAALDRYDRADENQVKRAADKALRLSDLATGSSAGAQSISNDNAYQTRIVLAKQLFDIEASRIDRLNDEGEKEKALAQARLDYEDELDKARTDNELRYLELQKKDLDQIHGLAEGFYDAIRRGGTGVQQFFSSQAQGVGKTLFANTVTEAYKSIGAPTLGGLIPGQTTTGPDGQTQLTAIGRILQGSPFGVGAKGGPQEKNTNALTTLTASVERLIARLGGTPSLSTDGAGSSLASLNSLPFSTPGSSNPFTVAALSASLPNGGTADGGDALVPGMIGVTYDDLGTMTQAALDATLTPSSSGTFGGDLSTLNNLPLTVSVGSSTGPLSAVASTLAGTASLMKAVTGGYGEFAHLIWPTSIV